MTEAVGVLHALTSTYSQRSGHSLPRREPVIIVSQRRSPPCRDTPALADQCGALLSGRRVGLRLAWRGCSDELGRVDGQVPAADSAVECPFGACSDSCAWCCCLTTDRCAFSTV